MRKTGGAMRPKNPTNGEQMLEKAQVFVSVLASLPGMIHSFLEWSLNRRQLLEIYLSLFVLSDQK